MDVDVAEVKRAIKDRRDFILSNLETISLRKVRRQLEEDLGLEEDGLKAHKDLIAKLIDKVIASAAPKEQPEESAAPAEEEDGGKGKGKGRKPKAKEEPKPSKQTKRKAEQPAAKASGPRQYSKRVVKLRNLCKEATITIPPSLYVKHKGDDELAEALEALLEKQGLSADSGKDEVAKVKRRLAMQRDLDGIDTSNIIFEGGRGRRQAATAPINYRQMVDSESEEEEEEEGSDSELGSEAEAGSDAESPKEAVKRGKQRGAVGGSKKARSRAGASSDDEGEEGSSSGGEEQEEFEGYQEASGSKDEGEEPSSPAASLDENQADPNGRVGAQQGKRATQPAPAAKAAPAAAAGLEDSSEDEEQAAKKQRRVVVADWSDDE